MGWRGGEEKMRFTVLDGNEACLEKFRISTEIGSSFLIGASSCKIIILSR